MKYLKLFENFYVGPVWTAGNRGPGTDIINTVTMPYRGYSYDDGEKAFKEGEKAFERGDNENPYEKEQFPDPNLISSWEEGYKTAEKNQQ